MRVNINESRELVIKNKNVSAISFKAFAKLQVANGAQFCDVNLSRILVKIQLKRGAQSIMIYNDFLAAVALESTFLIGPYHFAAKKDFEDIDGAAQNPLRMLPLTIDFNTVLNIKGSDQLIVEVTLGPDAFLNSGNLTADNVNQNQSYIEFDEVEDIGLEYFTPQIHTKTVPAGEGRWPFTLGENVTSIHLIHLPSGPLPIKDSPILSVQLESDKLSFTDSINELVAKRLSMFEEPTDARLRGHSYRLHKGTDLDRVELDVTFVPARVLVGQNLLVWRSFVADAETFNKAVSRSQRHGAYDAAKLRGRR